MNLVWFISYFDFRQQMFSVNSSLLKMTLLKLTGQQGLPVFQFCFQSSHRQHINNTLKTKHGLTCLQSSACFLSLNIGRALSASNLGRGQGRICSGFSVKKKMFKIIAIICRQDCIIISGIFLIGILQSGSFPLYVHTTLKIYFISFLVLMQSRVLAIFINMTDNLQIYFHLS